MWLSTQSLQFTIKFRNLELILRFPRGIINRHSIKSLRPCYEDEQQNVCYSSDCHMQGVSGHNQPSTIAKKYNKMCFRKLHRQCSNRLFIHIWFSLCFQKYCIHSWLCLTLLVIQGNENIPVNAESVLNFHNLNAPPPVRTFSPPAVLGVKMTCHCVHLFYFIFSSIQTIITSFSQMIQKHKKHQINAHIKIYIIPLLHTYIYSCAPV